MKLKETVKAKDSEIEKVNSSVSREVSRQVVNRVFDHGDNMHKKAQENYNLKLELKSSQKLIT